MQLNCSEGPRFNKTRQDRVSLEPICESISIDVASKTDFYGSTTSPRVFTETQIPTRRAALPGKYRSTFFEWFGKGWSNCSSRTTTVTNARFTLPLLFLLVLSAVSFFSTLIVFIRTSPSYNAIQKYGSSSMSSALSTCLARLERQLAREVRASEWRYELEEQGWDSAATWRIIEATSEVDDLSASEEIGSGVTSITKFNSKIITWLCFQKVKWLHYLRVALSKRSTPKFLQWVIDQLDTGLGAPDPFFNRHMWMFWDKGEQDLTNKAAGSTDFKSRFRLDCVQRARYMAETGCHYGKNLETESKQPKISNSTNYRNCRTDPFPKWTFNLVGLSDSWSLRSMFSSLEVEVIQGIGKVRISGSEPSGPGQYYISQHLRDLLQLMLIARFGGWFTDVTFLMREHPESFLRRYGFNFDDYDMNVDTSYGPESIGRTSPDVYSWSGSLEGYFDAELHGGAEYLDPNRKAVPWRAPSLCFWHMAAKRNSRLVLKTYQNYLKVLFARETERTGSVNPWWWNDIDSSNKRKDADDKAFDKLITEVFPKFKHVQNREHWETKVKATDAEGYMSHENRDKVDTIADSSRSSGLRFDPVGRWSLVYLRKDLYNGIDMSGMAAMQGERERWMVARWKQFLETRNCILNSANSAIQLAPFRNTYYDLLSDKENYLRKTQGRCGQDPAYPAPEVDGSPADNTTNIQAYFNRLTLMSPGLSHGYKTVMLSADDIDSGGPGWLWYRLYGISDWLKSPENGGKVWPSTPLNVKLLDHQMPGIDSYMQKMRIEKGSMIWRLFDGEGEVIGVLGGK